MQKILKFAALCAAFALVVPAPLAKAQSQGYGTQTQSQSKTKKKKAVVTHQRGPSPSGHPEWDVYVRGEYVGSDPDPRVRWTIRQEATRNYGFR